MRSSLALKTVLIISCTWNFNVLGQELSSSRPMNAVVDRAPSRDNAKFVSPLKSANTSKPQGIADCKLMQGKLVGKIHTPSGKVATNASLKLLSRRGETKAAKTDARGNFSFSGMSPGLYAVQVGNAKTQFVRIWTNELAPPTAKSQLLIVHGGDIVRGQFINDPASSECSTCGECDGDCGVGMSSKFGLGRVLQTALDNPWFVAAGTAAAIAIPLAATDDDERLGDGTEAVGGNGEDAS